jgi:hypothetical protein
MEFSRIAYVGAGDLQQATRTEATRIRQETKGDLASQLRLLLDRLKNENLISDEDAENLRNIFAANGEGKAEGQAAQDAYMKTRDIYHSMLASGKAGPVALTIASSTIGSFTIGPDGAGSGTMVIAKASNRWSQVGAAAGAAIGGRLLGDGGAGLGAIIGGAIGGAVDDCLA